MAYDLVVFDWDGTLMDSEARIVHCIQAAAEQAGLAVPSREAARDIIGLGLSEAIERLFPAAGPETVAKLVAGYRSLFLGETLTPSALFAGAREVLAELAGQGLLLGVATGKSRRGLDRELAAMGLGELFAVTRCADETFSKPHPQMLLEIMEVTGVEPARTLVVGDTEYDMQMAASAGAAGLGVCYGVHPPERLYAAGALACLDEIGHLPRWLNERLIRML